MSVSIITSLSGPSNKVRTPPKNAYACLDWSERAPHIGGSLGAALLELMLKRGWVSRHLDSRALKLTPKGAGGMAKAFGLEGGA
ncbi:ArsR family transcriptional regulator [Pseudomonas syringae]|nr:ArsR family transcriptional regulator [Pseudomonas syringae]POD19031.1 ArsR family transcriptional regulator [Pseudomonas syringae pv. syringae]UQB21878.1 ArsR family transcriptional regulator [Pseudomonas syringae pv. syringae]